MDSHATYASIETYFDLIHDLSNADKPESKEGLMSLVVIQKSKTNDKAIKQLHPS